MTTVMYRTVSAAIEPNLFTCALAKHILHACGTTDVGLMQTAKEQ